MKPYVDVLGTRYRIEIRKWSEDSYMASNGFEGYCSEDDKLIVVADPKSVTNAVYITETEEQNRIKSILRHEITHAFLNESGLSACASVFGSAWAKNEEMVDWIAIQFPKMLEAFRWCECI